MTSKHPRPPSRFPDGSASEHDRMSTAAVRAVDAYMRVTRQAIELIDAFDNVTSPGVVRTQLSDEDSLVIAIHGLIPEPITPTKG